NFYDYKITYQELNNYIECMASFLYNNGVKKGDTVAIFMQNSPHFVISYFAIQKIGAIVSPCNLMFKEWELKHQLCDLKAKTLISANTLVSVFKNIEKETYVENLIIADYKTFLSQNMVDKFPEDTEKKRDLNFSVNLNVFKFENTIKNNNFSFPKTTINMKEDTALIMYTSGTTGNPKGAMLTFKNSEFKTNCVIDTYNYSKSDIFLSVMPIFHIAGMSVGMLGPLAIGGTIIILTRFSPEAVLTTIERYKITVIYTTPPMNLAMLKEKQIKDVNL